MKGERKREQDEKRGKVEKERKRRERTKEGKKGKGKENSPLIDISGSPTATVH